MIIMMMTTGSQATNSKGSGPFDLNKDFSYNFLSRTLGGEDSFSLMGELISSQDWDTSFAEPSDALLILKNVEAFKMISGVEDLINKAESFSPDDVRKSSRWLPTLRFPYIALSLR